MRKYLFISGTSRGIGKAVALAALEKGYWVGGMGRTHTIDHPSYHPIDIDLGDEWSLANFEFPEVADAATVTLVNNAATLGDIHYNGSINDEKLINAYLVNLVAPASLCNHFIRKYRQYHCQKLIVNISTGAAFNAYDGWSIYCATKAGLEMLGSVISTEEATGEFPYPFTVKSVAPGTVATRMQEEVRASDEKHFSRRSKFVSLHEENKLVKPDIIAERYLDLIENPAKYKGLSHRLS